CAGAKRSRAALGISTASTATLGQRRAGTSKWKTRRVSVGVAVARQIAIRSVVDVVVSAATRHADDRDKKRREERAHAVTRNPTSVRIPAVLNTTHGGAPSM